MSWFRIKKVLLSAISNGIVYPCCLSASIFFHDAMAGTLVVVPPGLEQVEGNGRGGVIAPGSPAIFQEVYPASEFLGVPAGQNEIVAMRLRPNWSVRRPKVVRIQTYELRLSTTDADAGSLDPVLDQNRGDDEVIVYQGPLRWETDGAGPSEGPRYFDYIVDLQTPFLYDPSWGRSLLVEEIIGNGNTAPFWDADNVPGGGVRRRAAMPHTAPVGSYQWEHAVVRQFEFAAEPTVLQSGDADMDGDFDQMDLVQVQIAAKYLTDEPATWGEGDWNGAPGGSVKDKIPPPGDGQFNQLDVIAALGAGNYLQGSYCADGGAAAFAIPEPSTCLLLALGLTGMLCGCCRKR